MVIEGEGNSERYLKWDGGGSLIRGDIEGVTGPYLPPIEILVVHIQEQIRGRPIYLRFCRPDIRR